MPLCLHGAGLILCATGAVSLRGEDFSALRNKAYVATVTSSEDELDLAGLPAVYQRTPNGEHITRYQTTGHYFYLLNLLNGGNAVHFLHGTSVGPFIYLVQAEILASVRSLTRGDIGPGMHEINATDRATIVGMWLNYFNRQENQPHATHRAARARHRQRLPCRPPSAVAAASTNLP